MMKEQEQEEEGTMEETTMEETTKEEESPSTKEKESPKRGHRPSRGNFFPHHLSHRQSQSRSTLLSETVHLAIEMS